MQFWVKELVAVTLHIIMKLAEAITCWFLKKVKRDTCGFEMQWREHEEDVNLALHYNQAW